MTGEIIPASKNHGILKKDDAIFESMAKTTMLWVPIQLFGGNSAAVKDEKIAVNRYGVRRSKDDIEDLGKEMHLIPVDWRAKAVEFGDDTMSVYDPEDPEFQRIQVRADEPGMGAMYGVEFLLWNPKLGEFVAFFFGSKSTRRLAGEVRALMGKGIAFGIKPVENKYGKWPVPTITASALPMEGPAADALEAARDKFNNPPKNEVETVKDDGRAT